MGHHHANLRLLAVLALDIAAGEQVEFLLGGAKLDVGLENDGIVGHEQRVEQFVHRDGLLFSEALVKILALEHARDAVLPQRRTIS